MFKIKWENDINTYETTYYNPFVRLDSCNAAMYEVEHTSDNNALHHRMHTVHYGFVSYDTPICSIRYYHDLDTNKDGFNVTINRNMYKCSSATIHQFIRFLRKTMGDILTYQDVKYYDAKSGFCKDIAIADVCPIHIFWSDTHSMRYAMEETVHAIYHTNVAR